MVMSLLNIFVGLLTVEVRVPLILLPALGTLVMLLGCLTELWNEGLCLVFSLANAFIIHQLIHTSRGNLTTKTVFKRYCFIVEIWI